MSDIQLPKINLNGLAGTYANNYIYKGVENPFKNIMNTTDVFNATGELLPNNGQLATNKAYSLVDIGNAPSVLNEKGLNAWTNQEALKIDDSLKNSTTLVKDNTTEPGMFDWLGSDNMKGVGTIGGLAMSGLGLWNAMGAQKEAKRQWEAENARADEIMAMNREKYNQYKADRDRLNAGYGGK